MSPVHVLFGLILVLGADETAPRFTFVTVRQLPVPMPICAKVLKTRHNNHRSPLEPWYRGRHVRTTKLG